MKRLLSYLVMCWKYLKSLLRHKWFVLIECFKVGLYWRGIIHDWSKFLPSEFFPYAQYFYGTFIDEEEKAKVKTAFNIAWLHHQKRNTHHWQYWLLSLDDPKSNFGLTSHGEPLIYGQELTHYPTNKHVLVVLPEVVSEPGSDEARLERVLLADLRNTPVAIDMPLVDRKEMLADWKGAGKAYGSRDTLGWYKANREKQVMHENTRAWVDDQLRWGQK